MWNEYKIIKFLIERNNTFLRNIVIFPFPDANELAITEVDRRAVEWGEARERDQLVEMFVHFTQLFFEMILQLRSFAL